MPHLQVHARGLTHVCSPPGVLIHSHDVLQSSSRARSLLRSQVYFANIKTKETSWELPAAAVASSSETSNNKENSSTKNAVSAASNLAQREHGKSSNTAPFKAVASNNSSRLNVNNTVVNESKMYMTRIHASIFLRVSVFVRALVRVRAACGSYNEPKECAR